MNCLLNYVGIRSCGVAPESGVFINQFPGMSTELMDKIASQDQVTFIQVWKDIQNSAYLRFKSVVQDALVSFGSARFDQILYQTQKPFVQQWAKVEPKPEEAIFRGVIATITGSRYVGLKVKNILVFNSGNTDVQYVDVRLVETQTGKILWQESITMQPGMNKIFVNETFFSDWNAINIALLVDCTNLPTLDGTFMDYGAFGWGNLMDSCPSQFSCWVNQGYSIYPITADLNYESGNDWNNDNSQSGVYWDAELIASLDAFICSQKEDLLDAWTNLLCYYTLWTKMSSNRVNWFTNSNQEITNSNMATYDTQFKDAIKIWANQLNLQGEGMAFNYEDAAIFQNRGRMP
jgi:hypothetical protein